MEAICRLTLKVRRLAKDLSRVLGCLSDMAGHVVNQSIVSLLIVRDCVNDLWLYQYLLTFSGHSFQARIGGALLSHWELAPTKRLRLCLQQLVVSLNSALLWIFPIGP